MKKVLVFDTFSRIGGGLAYLTNIAEAFSSRGNRWQWIFYCNPAIRHRLSNLENGAEVHYGPDSLLKGGIKGFFQRKKILRHAINETKPDIVIAMNQLDYKLDIPSVLFLRNLLYFTVNDQKLKKIYPFKEFVRCRFLRAVTIKSISRADHLVTSTNDFKSHVLNNTIGKIMSTSVAPFGLNTCTLSDFKREYFRDTCEILFLQFNFYKGLDVALYALKRLVDMGLNVRMTITDSKQKVEKNQFGRFLRIIEKLNVDKNIKFAGLLDQNALRDIYLRTDVFWFPSYIESFGHGLLEAMANGLPCIVSDMGVFREIGKDSIAYFEPGNDKCLAEQTARFFANRQLCHDFGTNARVRSSDFTWVHHVEQFETILDKVIEKKS